MRVVEKHLRLHRVDRARDLPEEAKIRLFRDLRALFEAEASEQIPAPAERKKWLAKLVERIAQFLSISEAVIPIGISLAICGLALV